MYRNYIQHRLCDKKTQQAHVNHRKKTKLTTLTAPNKLEYAEKLTSLKMSPQEFSRLQRCIFKNYIWIKPIPLEASDPSLVALLFPLILAAKYFIHRQKKKRAVSNLIVRTMLIIIIFLIKVGMPLLTVFSLFFNIFQLLPTSATNLAHNVHSFV